MILHEDINNIEYRCSTPVQLRFNDIDMLGHVNNTIYFSFFDLAKSDYFNRVNNGVVEWDDVPIVIANINCDFIAPVTFDEQIEIKTAVESIGDKSFRLVQVLVNSTTGELKCLCRTVMVYFDTTTRIPISVPQQWRDSIAQYERGE
ncbi:MAG: acyl-CoA thioesterase [Muribaculaceae bacterium]|nr:acyl-CoA thioesterase [Muribaculaceae bacterium]